MQGKFKLFRKRFQNQAIDRIDYGGRLEDKKEEKRRMLDAGYWMLL